ncbi:hypothetical protein O1611_g6136 [Lasiodiplodia mahajangana]|uniref:Uncharacterized protein n=1 Tax=Lasiodiplodia mahajangana TaxID=1108764 RepID=A0ACC2JJF6_9PEZI|nr:hypothetical protein O1611_g6136 [Lasiodiplodia mahajangana]
MLPWEIQHLFRDGVTVQTGSKSQFYFILISGLQEGTRFRDIWVHLKRAVKRLEHVEVYPGSQEGWICVYKYVTYLKAMEALKIPIYVQATGCSSIIRTSDRNVGQPINIRLPHEPSRYIMGIIAYVAKWDSQPRNETPRVTEPSPKDRAPVIAHGTYIKGKGFGPFEPDIPGSKSSSVEDAPAPLYQAPSWGEIYTDHGWDGWSSSAPGYDDGRIIGHPIQQALHTVTLSGFHHNTTMKEVENFVRDVAARRRLKDTEFRFADGVTIVTRFKGDAKILRDSLNGRRLRSVPLTATRGKLPLGFWY